MRRLPAMLLPVACLSAAAAAAADGLPRCGVPDSLGVNIHFTDPRPGEMDMLAESGVKWIRMDFTWGGIERERGAYDFSRYDRLLAALEPHGIRALFILDYANRLYDDGLAPRSDEGRAAFARWAAAAATHFKGRGILWEMWNEPNLDGFWKPKADVTNYIALAKAVGTALRAAGPGELYIGPGVSRIDLGFLEACFKAGLLEHWRAVSVHPYRQEGPETAAAEYAELRAMIDRYAPAGRRIPILSGEWGYSAAWHRYEADRQGRHLPREWLVNLACGVPLSIWYDWHDDGTDPKEPEHHFGMVAHDYHQGRVPVYDPKPAYRAARTLARTLGGFDFRRRIPVCRVGPSPLPGLPGECSQKDWVLLFTRGEESRIAAWTASSEPRKVRVFVAPGPVRSVRHTGETGPDLTAGADGLELELGEAPLYLLPGSGDAWLKRAADGDARTIDYRPGAAATGVRIQLDAGGPSVELLPSMGTGIIARVANPGSARGALTVRAISSGRTVGETTVAPGAGDRQTFVRMATSVPVECPAGIRLALYDAEGVLLFVTPAQRQAGSRDFKEADAVSHRSTGDGDQNVACEHSLDFAPTDAGLPPGASGALRVKFRMAPGWRFIRVIPGEQDRPIEGVPEAFGIWVRGDGNKLTVTLRIQDSKGQTYQPHSVPLEGTDWRFVRLPLPPNDMLHWGGPNDGTMHLPLHWDSLLIVDKPKEQDVRGEILIARPTLYFSVPPNH